MALTMVQANDVNKVIGHLTGNPGIPREYALDALARLADAAYKTLHAGHTADSAREHLQHRWADAEDGS